METLVRGSNVNLPRLFTQADGSALTLADMASLTVSIRQAGAAVATYTYGTDNECRLNSSVAAGNGALLEITPTVSAALSPGQLIEKWTVTLTDTAYVASGNVRTRVFEFCNVNVR
jgi:hypothetical protein